MKYWTRRFGWVLLLSAMTACATQNETNQNTWPKRIALLQSGISSSSVLAALPNDVQVVTPGSGTPSNRAAFSGLWHGWLCISRQCDAKLAIEKVSALDATAVYAGASHGAGNQFVQRGPASFVGNELVMPLRTGSKLFARLRNDKEMEIMLRRSSGELLSFGILTNTPLEFGRISDRVPTPFTRDGKAIELELVRFKPNGKGPFPTVVFNHGSTDYSRVGLTWISPELVSFFTKRGMQIVFPQRRGRGRSDGEYDEGYDDTRTQYSCEPSVSIAGIDRAIADTKAVVNFLKTHQDVNANQILMAGMSRGGILSVAYAGQYPNDVTGALNFVGGWMGEACKTVAQINPVIFERGAAFPKPTLWLYGEKDAYYSIKHSRSNFDAFKSKGGRGEFQVYRVPRGSGHWLHAHPTLWKDAVDGYLKKLK